MDRAHLGDLVPIAATDVGQIDGWKKKEWYCLGCAVRMVPKACDRRKNPKKVPYFSTWPRAEHKDCGLRGIESFIEKARQNLVRASDRLLGSLPYSVTFPDGVKVVPEPLDSGTFITENDAQPGTSPVPPSISHRPSRKSIHDICKIHAACRNNTLREAIPLNAQGCVGTDYRESFYQLQNLAAGTKSPKLFGCIFYGELRFRAKPNYGDPNRLVITLNCGRGSTDRYRVIVNWEDWSAKLRASFEREMETNRQAENSRYDANPGKFKPDVIVYFLGEQSKSDPMEFVVSEYPKIAVVYEVQGLYSDPPNHSFLKQSSSVGVGLEWADAAPAAAPVAELPKYVPPVAPEITEGSRDSFPFADRAIEVDPVVARVPTPEGYVRKREAGLLQTVMGLVKSWFS